MSDAPAGRLSASSVTTLNFQPSSTTLTHQSAVTLRGLIMQVGVNGCLRVEIVGYASPAEPPERQQALSAERAESLRSKLMQDLRLPANRVSSVGRGSADATGNPEKDPRVVISVFR